MRCLMKRTMHSLPYRLNEIVTQLSPDKPDMLPDLEMLKVTHNSIVEVKKLFGQSGKTWLDKPYFSPSKNI